MKKTIVAASLSLALGTSTSASAAFFEANSTYRVDVSGGCMAFGDCTALAQNVGTGSFTLTTDGTGDNFTVTNYSGIDYTGTPGGLFETGGLVAGSGSVSAGGQLDLNFTGRTGTAEFFPQYAGAAWNIDNNTKQGGTGVYEGFTTSSDSNVSPNDGSLGLTLTGTNLAPIVAGTTTGVLVSVGNVGTSFAAFDGTPYSEVYNITVTATSGVPTAEDDLVATPQGALLVIDIAADLLANDMHPIEGEVLTLTSVSLTTDDPLSTVVQDGNGTTLTYTPNPASLGIGLDGFTYTVEDESGNPSTASVSVNLTTGTAAIANPDVVAVNEDEVVTFDPVAGAVATAGVVDDTDVDGLVSALAVVSTELTTVALNGTVSQINNDVTYLPNADFNGSDTFSYRIQDADGNLSTTTVTMNVAPINDVPVCTDVTLAAAIDTPLQIDVENDLLSTTSTPPLCTDIEGDAVTLNAIDATGSEGGTMSDDGAGTLTYTPSAGYIGPETFSYTAADGVDVGVANTLTINVSAGLADNFTMLNKTGDVFGGTNDVTFDWDEVSFNTTTVINSPNTGVDLANDMGFGDFITIGSPNTFFAFNWTAHHIRIFQNTSGSPITLNFDVTCTAADYDSGIVDCNRPLSEQDAIQQYLTLTLQPGEIGAHILFDWNAASNIDVVTIWKENAVWDTHGDAAPRNELWLGEAGLPPARDTDWRLVSADVPGDGKENINGSPMVDGAFIGFFANFNYKPAALGVALPPFTGEISEVDVDGFSMGLWSLLGGLLTLFGLRGIKNKK